jgi:hypothetical protein
MDSIWPLFDLDDGGTITKAEWARFVSNKVAWSYQLLTDRFANLIGSEGDKRAADEAKVSAKATTMHHLGVDSPRPPAGKRRTKTKTKNVRPKSTDTPPPPAFACAVGSRSREAAWRSGLSSPSQAEM